MNAKAAEIQLLQRAGKILDANLIREWTEQGHHLTGAWEQSLHGNVLSTAYRTSLTGTMAQYGIYVNLGVSADRIPYGGHSATGGTSKYIQGLVAFWKLRGLSDKEAMRAAFATAKKQKKEGMPTSGSYQFSKTGQRLHFIQIVEKVITEGINDIISEGIDSIIDRKFHETKSERI